MKKTLPNEQWSTREVVICVGAALLLAAIEIIFFTPVVFGNNQR